jgi:hypothetical protein
MANKLKKYVGTVTVEATSELQAHKRFNNYVQDKLDMGNCAGIILDNGFKVASPEGIKLMVVQIYRDEPVFVTLIDDGQDFKKLFKEFNKQDNPAENEDWLGFSDFMESKGVQLPSCVTTECLEYY